MQSVEAAGALLQSVPVVMAAVPLPHLDTVEAVEAPLQSAPMDTAVLSATLERTGKE